MRQLNIITSALCLFLLLLTGGTASSQNESFQMREVACGLSQPWEITWGPDNFLWVTEAHSYEITRVNPQDGSSHVVIDLSGKKDFPNSLDPFPQGGLMGMAFHPQMLTGKPWVYVAYVHHFEECLPDNQGCYFNTKLVRYTYNTATQTLSDEVVIIDTLPGSNDHNGGRLVIGATEGGNYLFYSIGDMAAGHLMNEDRPHHGQLLDSYEGKILRFNLEPDNDPGTVDSWIPNTNPFNEGGDQSAIWSLGHRNPQGLVFGNGILYESEHGPYSDDEINIIEPGINYGFPLVMGFAADGNYDGSAAGAGSGVPLVSSETANRQLIENDFSYLDPLESLFAATQTEVSTYYDNDVNNTEPFDNYYLTWPTIAPSGMDYYGAGPIPGWQNSLLVTALKLGKVYRIPLSEDGHSVVGDTIAYFDGMGRFRDIALHPDGMRIYVSTDSVGQIAGPPGVGVQPPNKGCILEFTYLSTGVDEAVESSVQIFPNPTQHTVNVDLGLLAGERGLRLTVSNLLGMNVMEREVGAFGEPQVIKLDVSDLEVGSYVLSLQTDSEQGQRQRVVRKLTVLRQ